MPTVYEPSPRQSATGEKTTDATSVASFDQMPTKKTKKSTSKKSSKSPKKKSSKKGKDKKKQPPPDVFSPAAMSNAYYISHDAVDFLTFRGYRWEGATTKKKKKK